MLTSTAWCLLNAKKTKKKIQKNLKKKPNSNYKTDKMTQTAKKDKNFVRKK